MARYGCSDVGWVFKGSKTYRRDYLDVGVEYTVLSMVNMDLAGILV